jgi:hypothetical protein
MPTDSAVETFQKGFNTSEPVILPSQVGRADWKPEQDLLGEMILYAVKDARLDYEELQLPRDKAFKRYLDQTRALAWIFSPGMEPFSFEWVCQHVGVDPEWMRRDMRASCARAPEIEKHLKDPENVLAPEIPQQLLIQHRPRRTGRRRVVPA